MKRKPGTLFLFVLLSYASLYIGRKNYSLCMPMIMEEGLLSTVQVGFIGTAFLIFYAAGQGICGIVGDHVMPYRMIKLGLAGSGISNLLMGLVPPHVMAVVWGCNGIFCSMLWAPSIRLLGITQPGAAARRRASEMILALPVGTIICYSLSGLMLSNGTGWRMTFILSGLLILLVAMFDFHIFRAKDIQFYEVEQTTGTKSDKKGREIRLLALLHTGLIGLAITIMFNGVLKDGLDLWVQTIFTEHFGIDISTTVMISFLFPILSVLGVFISRYLLENVFHNEMITCTVLYLVSSVALMIFAICAWFFVPENSLMAALISGICIAIALALVNGINNIVLTFIPMDYIKLNLTSTITGIFDSLSYLSAAISGIVAGLLSEHLGWISVIIYFLLVCIGGLILSIVNISSYRKGQQKLKSLTEKRNENIKQEVPGRQ